MNFQEQRQDHETTITTLRGRKDKWLERLHTKLSQLKEKMNSPNCEACVYEKYEHIKQTIKNLSITNNAVE